jgi:hypothetical protein
VGDLDGIWHVERVAGALPPMAGVRKVIRGSRGETRVWRLRMPFDVVGLELRYRGPFRGLVDRLEPDGDGYRGRATYLGRPLGRFAMRRA